MKISRYPLLTLALVLLVTGCTARTRSMSGAGGMKGSNVVCILFHDSYFNYLLKEKISKYVIGRGYKVVSDEEFLADRYRPGDYAAVVIMAKHEAKGSMKIIDEFVARYGGRGNVIVSISHEWDIDGSTIKKEYDAFTAASKDFEQDEVLEKIKEGLDSVLKK